MYIFTVNAKKTQKVINGAFVWRTSGNKSANLSTDRERGGELQPKSPFLSVQHPSSRDELYSPFLSCSCRPTGSSISISQSLLWHRQQQLSFNQSNQKLWNRAQNSTSPLLNFSGFLFSSSISKNTTKQQFKH